MKKLSLLLLAGVAFTLASCCGNDYRNAIPADAFVVVSVNPGSLAQKANVGDFTQSPLYKIINQSLTIPAETGIDMNSDAYFFVKAKPGEHGMNAHVGVVLKVKHQAKAAEMLAMMEDEGIDEDEVRLDKNALVVYTGSLEGESVNTLFEMPKEARMKNQRYMASFFRGGNDIQLALNYGPMIAAVDQTGMAAQMPGLEFIKSMVLVAQTNFEQGRISTTGDVLFSTDEARASYEKLLPMYKRLDNGFLTLLPEKNIATLASGLNGTEVYNFLNQIPMYATLLAMAPQAKTIMSAIDGDIAVAFHGMNMDNKTMPVKMSAIAQINDPAVGETIKSLIPSKGFEWLTVGVKENTLYATTDASALPHLTGAQQSTFQTRMADLFGGAYSVMHFDVKLISAMISEGIAAKMFPVGAAVAVPILDQFESFEMRSPEMSHVDMTLHMTDKEKNAAETIYKMIEGYAQVAAMVM